MLYPWLVFLHIIAIFGFLMAHGASAMVAYTIRGERNLERVSAMLEVSGRSYPVMYLSLLVLLITGIITGIMADWYKYAWFWVSIVGLFVIYGLMQPFGSKIFGAARKAAGLPYFEKGKQQPPVDALPEEEIFAILAKINPHMLTTIGFGGIAIIAYLMMFKPF